MDFVEGKLKLIANSVMQKGTIAEDVIQNRIHKNTSTEIQTKKGSECFSLCVKSERERESRSVWFLILNSVI